MRTKYTRLATLVVSLGSMAVGCSGTDAEEAKGGPLRVGVAAPVLRASTGSVGLTYHLNALTTETMVAISAEGRPVPRVLDSWSVSADRLTWQLKIRKGVRFHDGTPVTAAILAEPLARFLAQTSLGAVRGVTAGVEDMLVLTLLEPYAFLFEDLALFVVTRAVDGQTFGTGPYKAVEQSADRLKLSAVSDHYRGAPAIESVEVQLFPDQRNAWSALMRDQIDMLYDVMRDSLDFIRGESGIRVATFPRPYVYLLGLNVGSRDLADSRVRRALDIAVDREELVDVAMAGEGEPAHGHVWPRHWTFNAEASAVRPDQREAVRLLNEAGLKVTTEPGRMPARLRIHCLVYDPLREMGLVLQRQLAQVGVDLQLEVLPADQFLERITSGRFESFVFEMASARGYKWPYQFWHSSTPYLKHGYSGADAVLDAMRRSADDEAFLAAAIAFQRRLHEDPPAVFLAWGRTSRAVSTRFEFPDGDDDIYHTIGRWKLASTGAN